MFSINPIEILKSPFKSGFKLVCIALVLILPFIILYLFEMFIFSHAQDKSNDIERKKEKEETERISKTEKRWINESKEVDEERSKS